MPKAEKITTMEYNRTRSNLQNNKGVTLSKGQYQAMIKRQENDKIKQSKKLKISKYDDDASMKHDSCDKIFTDRTSLINKKDNSTKFYYTDVKRNSSRSFINKVHKVHQENQLKNCSMNNLTQPQKQTSISISSINTNTNSEFQKNNENQFYEAQKKNLKQPSVFERQWNSSKENVNLNPRIKEISTTAEANKNFFSMQNSAKSFTSFNTIHNQNNANFQNNSIQFNTTNNNNFFGGDLCQKTNSFDIGKCKNGYISNITHRKPVWNYSYRGNLANLIPNTAAPNNIVEKKQDVPIKPLVQHVNNLPGIIKKKIFKEDSTDKSYQFKRPKRLTKNYEVLQYHNKKLDSLVKVNCFKEKDLRMSKDFAQRIIYQQADNDVSTDEEQIVKATRSIYIAIRVALDNRNNDDKTTPIGY